MKIARYAMAVRANGFGRYDEALAVAWPESDHDPLDHVCALSPSGPDAS